MDLTPHAAHLHRELLVAAEAGGAEARALAARLTGPLDSAVRLVLLDALSEAAEEITRELAPGSVEIRLRARMPEFVVTPPPAEDADDDPDGPAAWPAAPATATPPADESGPARLTLRLPDQLKARVESAAAAEGVSVNAWLVRAVATAIDPATPRAARFRPAGAGGDQRLTGWVR